LRSTLLAADAIFVPDTKSSTAGIHVAKVIEQLRISGEVADRLRTSPTARRRCGIWRIGCASAGRLHQSTEIISTKGAVLSGSLPPGYELATMYTAAVTARATAAEQAQRLIELLTTAGASEIRRHAGFVATPDSRSSPSARQWVEAGLRRIAGHNLTMRPPILACPCISIY
jgi:molybdate transport system substrate-binding protein